LKYARQLVEGKGWKCIAALHFEEDQQLWGYTAPVRLLLAILIPAVLATAGCDSASDNKATSAKRREQRQQAAAETMAKTPVPRTYGYTDGELRVLEVPTTSIAGFVEKQRCFVWRDHEFKTATLSCPSTTIDVGPDGQ
jgi:hypothetical protein